MKQIYSFVMIWIIVLGFDFASALMFGSELSSRESNMLLAFIITWCVYKEDEKNE